MMLVRTAWSERWSPAASVAAAAAAAGAAAAAAAVAAKPRRPPQLLAVPQASHGRLAVGLYDVDP